MKNAATLYGSAARDYIELASTKDVISLRSLEQLCRRNSALISSLHCTEGRRQTRGRHSKSITLHRVRSAS